MKDKVNHPSHYMSKKGIETIDVIEAFTEGLEGMDAVCTGNALKYICRWKHKNGIEDLKKARWYINRLIGDEDDKDAWLSNQDINKVDNKEPLNSTSKRPTFAYELYNKLFFDKLEDAKRILASLEEISKEHGYATMADLLSLMDYTVKQKDEYTGWTFEEINSEAFYIDRPYPYDKLSYVLTFPREKDITNLKNINTPNKGACYNE